MSDSNYSPTHRHPLNYGELTNLADLYVSADLSKTYTAVETHAHVPRSAVQGLVEVYDAESELVCFVPADKAELMVRLINTYKWHNEHDPL